MTFPVSQPTHGTDGGQLTFTLQNRSPAMNSVFELDPLVYVSSIIRSNSALLLRMLQRDASEPSRKSGRRKLILRLLFAVQNQFYFRGRYHRIGRMQSDRSLRKFSRNSRGNWSLSLFDRQNNSDGVFNIDESWKLSSKLCFCLLQMSESMLHLQHQHIVGYLMDVKIVSWM